MTDFDSPAAPAADAGLAQPEPARRSWLKRLGALLGGTALAAPALARPASPLGGTNSYVGEIVLLACDFAPRNFALCQGQLLSIASNTALFSILGTTYGGNGQTTFALPDLRGAAAIGAGQGPGLTVRDLGERVGTPTRTLLTAGLPAHQHPARVSNAAGTSSSPALGVPAVLADGATATGEAIAYFNRAPAPNAAAAAAAVAAAGSQQAFELSPYLALNYCICLFGVFPPRP